MDVTGGCLCRAIRFEGDAEPQFQVTCYCTDCRRTSGTGHAAMMGFTDDAIRVTPGAREFASWADSGNDIIRAFCPTCGSGICSRTAGTPSYDLLACVRARRSLAVCASACSLGCP